jgi:ABC-type spermidine/putrescine transport system permease subunit I
MLSRLVDGTGLFWLLLIPVSFLALVFVLPLIVVIIRAVQDLGPEGIYRTVTEPLFLRAVLRTVILAATVTAIVWFLGTILSLCLALTRGWLRGFLLLCLLTTFWISLLARTYGWILIYQPNGALNTVLEAVGLISEPLRLLQTDLAMYPAMVHVMLPYYVLPVVAVVLGLDPRQLRAAQSLGAGPGRVLARVILPQLRNGTIAGVTLVFILSLGFFVTPQLLGGPSNLTVATLINLQFSELFEFGAAAAMGAVLLLGVVMLYLVADWVFKVNFGAER